MRTSKEKGGEIKRADSKWEPKVETKHSKRICDTSFPTL